MLSSNLKYGALDFFPLARVLAFAVTGFGGLQLTRPNLPHQVKKYLRDRPEGNVRSAL